MKLVKIKRADGELVKGWVYFWRKRSHGIGKQARLGQPVAMFAPSGGKVVPLREFMGGFGRP